MLELRVADKFLAELVARYYEPYLLRLSGSI